MAFTWAESAIPANGGSTIVQRCLWISALSRFVAVISTGTSKVMTSDDGVTWTLRTASQLNSWRDLAWSPSLNLMVAVCGSGVNQVMSSADGFTWANQVASGSSGWQGVAWSPSLNLFAAVTNGGASRVMTSPNGVNWTNQSASSAKSWQAIEWSASLGLFVALAGTSGTASIMTSSDGTNWSDQSTPVTTTFRARGLAYSPDLGMFVACSGGSHMLRSTDGVNWFDWAGLPTGWASSSNQQVVWCPELSLFVATAGNNDDEVITSADGITWVVESNASFRVWDAMAYSPALQSVVLFPQGADFSMLGVGVSADTIDPVTGPANGGTSVTITGTGFTANTRVYVDYDANFGTLDPDVDILNYLSAGYPEATSVVILDSETLTCVMPIQGNSPAVKTVVVLVDQGSAVTPNIASYLPEGFTTLLPVAVSISPAFGPRSGGTAVTLTCTNVFEGGSGDPGVITFDGVAATSVEVVNATTITCVTPDGTTGLADVIYTPPTLTVVSTYTYPATTLAAAYTYMPTLASCSPNVGCASTAVTLTGTGFVVGATVTVGGVAATSVVVVSSTSITCVTDVHADGAVDIVVTNPDTSTVTLVSGFTYGMPWWVRLTTILYQGNTYVFSTYVQACAEPTDGEYDLTGLTAPVLLWWSLPTVPLPSGATSPAIAWWALQPATPGVGWVPGPSGGTVAPTTPDGWYFSLESFGGSTIVVSAGTPRDPRTWADIAAWATGTTGMLGGSPAASCLAENRTLYPGTGYTVGTDYPPIRIFDGLFDHVICRLPPTTTNGVPKAVMSMLAANGTVYLSSFDSGSSSADWRGRVFTLDRISGVITPMGVQFAAGEMPYALAWHMGRLWCGTNNGIGTVGKVYWFRPGIDTAWTLDHSLSTESLGGVNSMRSFKGLLYVGSDNAAGSRGKILVRDTAGAYTVSETGAGGTTNVNNGYLAMVEFEDNLYASYWTTDSSIIRKFDNATWTTVYTGAAATLRPFILLIVDRDQLFAFGGGKLLSGAVVRTENGTSWTNLTAQLPESDKTLLPIYSVEVL